MERWTPSNVIRLIALIGGFGGFYWGATLVQAGIAAEGTVDIRAALFSGTLKTGSAGLFVCFFALAIIAFVIIPLTRRELTDSEIASRAESKVRRLYPLLYALLVALGIASVGGFTFAVGFVA